MAELTKAVIRFLMLGLPLLTEGLAGAAAPLGTGFTYQGRLEDGNLPANGLFDFSFRLYDAETGGTSVGLPPIVSTNLVATSNGVFSVDLDFGAVFNGDRRWLDISVNTNLARPLSALIPRQSLHATPYALHALKAGTANTATTAGGVPWAGITGLPPGLADGIDNDTTYTAGLGLSLIGTTFSVNPTFGDGRYWALAGNSGTTAGLNFLGTTDNQPLELKANNARALRLEPNVNSPNLIGGHVANTVTSGLFGASIGGGGAANQGHLVAGSYGTIAGGIANTNTASYASIGGGIRNRAAGQEAVVAGGSGNAATAGQSTVAGGIQNSANASQTTVSGGALNNAGGVSSTIGGGQLNLITPRVTGSGQFAETNTAASATIAGGGSNIVYGANASIGGGATNRAERQGATVSGGERNIASGLRSSVGGGEGNTASATWSTVPGGQNNIASGQGSFAAGTGARSMNSGSFAWADGQGGTFSTDQNNQFAVRASAGLMIEGSASVLDLRGNGGIRVAGAGINTLGPAFTHRATVANVSGAQTVIDHPHCNSRPNAILIVTYNFNPAGVAGTRNDKPTGLYYTGTRWAIYNMDSTSMPVGAAYNILVVNP